MLLVYVKLGEIEGSIWSELIWTDLNWSELRYRTNVIIIVGFFLDGFPNKFCKTTACNSQFRLETRLVQLSLNDGINTSSLGPKGSEQFHLKEWHTFTHAALQIKIKVQRCLLVMTNLFFFYMIIDFLHHGAVSDPVKIIRLYKISSYRRIVSNLFHAAFFYPLIFLLEIDSPNILAWILIVQSRMSTNYRM